MARKRTAPPRRPKALGLAEPKAAPFKAAATWQLQHAKDHFSELVEAALRSGPQEVTRHGKSTVMVISRQEYDRLAGASEKPGFADYLLNAPRIGLEAMGVDLDAERRQQRKRRGNPFTGI